MSDLSYDRCPSDDWKVGFAEIGKDLSTGKPVELNINGVASVVAVQSALTTLSAAMKAGHEEDFLEKVTLCLFGKLEPDPHALCPLLAICSMLLLLITNQVGVSFQDGKVRIHPEEVEVEGGDACMYDDGEDEDDGSDEGTMGDDGIGLCGGSPGDDGEGLSP